MGGIGEGASGRLFGLAWAFLLVFAGVPGWAGLLIVLAQSGLATPSFPHPFDVALMVVSGFAATLLIAVRMPRRVSMAALLPATMTVAPVPAFRIVL